MADKILSLSAGRKAAWPGVFGQSDAPTDLSLPRELKPDGGGWIVIVFLIVFGGVWNGFVWTMLIGNMRSALNSGSGFDWVFALFLIPFALVGLGIVGLVIYMGLGLFNPRPVVTVDPGAARLGAPFEVRWRLNRPSTRVKSLAVVLQGVETATYRQGTDTRTETEVFYEATLSERTSTGFRSEAWSGSAEAVVPADQMHTWSASNNGVSWRIKVKGSIPRWPDIDADFELPVVPAGWTPSPEGLES